jgi:hypothetical protein
MSFWKVIGRLFGLKPKPAPPPLRPARRAAPARPAAPRVAAAPTGATSRTAPLDERLPMDRPTRLAIEKRIIDRFFPQSFVWANPTAGTYVIGLLRTNGENRYRIKICVPDDYPNSAPSAYVVEPRLRGPTVYCTSAKMHTLAPDDDGHPQICHCRTWAVSDTIYMILVKIRFWLEAYEGYCRTGEPIEVFLKHAK